MRPVVLPTPRGRLAAVAVVERPEPSSVPTSGGTGARSAVTTGSSNEPCRNRRSPPQLDRTIDRPEGSVARPDQPIGHHTNSSRTHQHGGRADDSARYLRNPKPNTVPGNRRGAARAAHRVATRNALADGCCPHGSRLTDEHLPSTALHTAASFATHRHPAEVKRLRARLHELVW